MKAEVIKILKEKGLLVLFTDQRYITVKDLMRVAMKKDNWLKNYLSLDPLNKSQWIADYIVKLVELNKI